MNELMLFKLVLIAFFISYFLNMGWVFAFLHYSKVLKIRYPRVYRLLGNPPCSLQEMLGNSSVIYMANTMQTITSLATVRAIISTLCFLLKKRDLKLNDLAFSKHSRLLRYYFYLCLLAMLGLFFMVGLLIYLQSSGHR